MKSRVIAFLLALFIMCFSLSGCEDILNKSDDDFTIVCSMFAPYDFVKNIVGDRAEVVMLLPPGVESHSYEPTPSDIIEIENSEMFFYVSKNTETWVSQIVNSIENSDVNIIEIADELGIKIHEHDHEKGEDHEDEHDSASEMDEHIWTNLEVAEKMVEYIAVTLGKEDAENAEYYKKNADEYINEIKQLDSDFKTLVSTSKRKEIVSGSRFAMKNFTAEYGLRFVAAFDSCVDNTEPSATVMATIIDTIKNDSIPVIFYEELVEPKIARAVSIETGAKMLLLHSCHNISSDELKRGETYVSLMRENYKNLREALN